MLNRTVKNRNHKALTLMEMVIALVIMTVVFAAVLPQFRLISNSWDARQASADTIQNGRVFVDYLNRTLAKAVKVTAVSESSDTDGYIEFEDTSGTIYRCDLGANNYIRFGQTANMSDLAGPAASLTFYCYSLDDMDTPTTTVEEIRFVRIDAVFTNASATGQDKTFIASAFLQANGNIEEVQDSGPSLPGIIVKDQVSYGGYNAVFDSYNSSLGSYASQTPGSEVVVTTNSKSNNDFTLYSGARINGDGFIGKNGNLSKVMKLYGGSVITGTTGVLENNITISNNNFPSGNPFKGNPPTLNLWGGQQITVTEDTYYNYVYINNGTKLIVDGNVIIGVKKDFYVSSNGALELTEGSTLKLYIKQSAGIGGYMNRGGNPDDLRIYMTGNRDFQMYSQAEVYAVLTNPKADVEIWNTSPFYGLIIAEDLYGDSPIHIDMDARFDSDLGTSTSGSIAEVLP